MHTSIPILNPVLGSFVDFLSASLQYCRSLNNAEGAWKLSGFSLKAPERSGSTFDDIKEIFLE